MVTAVPMDAGVRTWAAGRRGGDHHPGRARRHGRDHDAEVRQIAGSVAILIAAHLAAFELEPALAVAAWAVLAVAPGHCSAGHAARSASISRLAPSCSLRRGRHHR